MATTISQITCTVLIFSSLTYTTNLLAAAEQAREAESRPNIIIVMVDDMGYSDLGCYGGEIETPHLDALANHGLRYKQFYNTARCCPTRAALLTGLYQHQAGIGHMVGNLGTPAYQGYLNDQCMTIAEALKHAGYATLMTGKWHVGSKQLHWPLQRGFDKYFGTPSGGGVYFKDALKIRKNVFFTLGNEKIDFPDVGYVTDLFTDYAIKFIEQVNHTEQPFFLYLAHIAPHWPLQAKQHEIEKYKGRYDDGWDNIRAKRFAKQKTIGLFNEQTKLSPRDPEARAWSVMSQDKQKDLAHRMAVYAAQIDCIDQNIGRLIESIKKQKQFDNTLILFLSDNGCSAEGGPGGFRRGNKSATIGRGDTYASVGLEWANVADTPLRKFKIHTFEGGISTPLIAHWPDGIKRKGEWESQPGHVIDLLPTCLDVAHVTYPKTYNGKPIKPLAGASLLPTFNRQQMPQRHLYWEHTGNKAVRVGDWKLVSANNQPWELYNLKTDRTELNDLSSSHTVKVDELKMKWQNWASESGVRAWPIKKPRKGR